MRLAVVGAGIAGLAVQQGRDYRIDTGFIVYNPEHYLLLTRLFGELAVISQPTQMSFSVHNQATGLEYNATNLDTLFCPRSNLGSPRFLGMGCDLRRFYREAPAREFPARFLVQFMSNHQMLQMAGRPQWRVVRGGSSSYVRALRARRAVCERLNCAVRSIRRRPDGVELEIEYHHPIHTRASVAAQSRKAEIQGKRRTWFAGAYWGWGFHEDGMRSAVDVAGALGVPWPSRMADAA